MGKIIALIVVGIGIFVLVKATATRPNVDIHPEFQKMLDHADERVKSDWEGEIGQKAIETCRRVLGITVPVKTPKDVLVAYDLDRYKAFGLCVVNTMYPLPEQEYSAPAGSKK